MVGSTLARMLFILQEITREYYGYQNQTPHIR